MEEQQRNNAANLIMDHKRGKVDLELKTDAREEADTELKRQAQELPGEKREEFMRRGREKLQNQQRLELEKWANQQERDAESSRSHSEWHACCCRKFTHKREHAVIINEQRRQPFKLLESELVKELDDLMIAAGVLLTGDATCGGRRASCPPSSDAHA